MTELCPRRRRPGVFTRALLARGVAAENLVLVESGSEFLDALRRAFPRAELLGIDAATLRSAVITSEWRMWAGISQSCT
jgi:phospholipid N-methyltransferase